MAFKAGRWALQFRSRASIVLLCAMVPAAGHAQLRAFAATDAVLSSRYNWRGLTRTSSWVVQPDLYVSIAGSRVSPAGLTIDHPNLTIGGWANYEFAAPGSDGIGERGSGQRGIGELNAWAQLGGSLGMLTLTTGWIHYAFQGEVGRPGALTSADDTHELFARADLDFRPASVAVSWWNDVDDVGGAYWETGLHVRLPLQPIPFPQIPLDPFLAVLDLGVVAGWNSGQSIDVFDGSGYFLREGLTHAHFSMSSSVLVGRQISFEPRLNLQINRDDRTKILSRTSNRGAVWWFSLTVSWLDIFGNGVR